MRKPPPHSPYDPRTRPWPAPPGLARTSTQPLPPYRFLPGLAPHPVTSPHGHSFARQEEPEAGDAGFRFGADLYNHGCWWEAHEAWEDVWLEAQPGSAPHLALQGLIQVANAHLKLELGRRNAVVRLVGKYRRLFLQAGAQPLSVYRFDLAPWQAAVEDYFARRLAAEPLAHDRASYPWLRLE